MVATVNPTSRERAEVTRSLKEVRRRLTGHAEPPHGSAYCAEAYSRWMKELLLLEHAQEQIDIRNYDMEGVPMLKSGQGYLALEVGQCLLLRPLASLASGARPVCVTLVQVTST
jgi:hypothetical protein